MHRAQTLLKCERCSVQLLEDIESPVQFFYPSAFPLCMFSHVQPIFLWLPQLLLLIIIYLQTVKYVFPYTTFRWSSSPSRLSCCLQNVVLMLKPGLYYILVTAEKLFLISTVTFFITKFKSLNPEINVSITGIILTLSVLCHPVSSQKTTTTTKKLKKTRNMYEIPLILTIWNCCGHKSQIMFGWCTLGSLNDFVLLPFGSVRHGWVEKKRLNIVWAVYGWKQAWREDT